MVKLLGLGDLFVFMFLIVKEILLIVIVFLYNDDWWGDSWWESEDKRLFWKIILIGFFENKEE